MHHSHDRPPNSDGSDLSRLSENLRQSLSEAAEPSDVFGEFTRRLENSFYIHRGVLVVRRSEAMPLAAISTWHQGQLREGLTIRLPEQSSLFARVIDQGVPFTEDYCGNFSGNFFERKLLLDETTRSYVLQPLKCDGTAIGLVGYSSNEPTAFALFEDGLLDKAVAEMAEIIRERIMYA